MPNHPICEYVFDEITGDMHHDYEINGKSDTFHLVFSVFNSTLKTELPIYEIFDLFPNRAFIWHSAAFFLWTGNGLQLFSERPIFCHGRAPFSRA